MRNIVEKVCGVAAASLAGLSLIGFLPGGHSSAIAGGSVKKAGPEANLQYGNAHQSVLHISERDLTQTKGITLGRNKSMLIELPRDLRDVIVSSPDTVDAVVQSSNRVYLIGKRTGQANVFLFDSNGDQILTLEIVVEYDTAALDSLYRRLLPGSNIKTEILNETVILTGSVRSPIDATRASDIASRFIMNPDAKAQEGDSRATRKVINMLAVEAEDQVQLRVVVAEVERSVLKQFGINMAADINAGNFAYQILTANTLPLTAAAGLGSLPVPGFSPVLDSKNLCSGTTCLYNNGPTSSTFGNSGVTGGVGNGNIKLNQALRALEREGLVRTLAEPNLTAVSGETAKFLAGGEYPIPSVDSTGQISVTFKEFGVGVAFTPVVLTEGRISLKIETEVSELSNDGAVTLSNISIPALKKRQAKSTVEVPSGGSIALAGLIREETKQNIDGFPGLKDLPVLGTLFRSRDFIKSETELVVIVTPYLVRPTARSNLARPSDGLAPATDMKANFLGHLNRIYGKGDPVPDGGLKGDYGFIVE